MQIMKIASTILIKTVMGTVNNQKCSRDYRHLGKFAEKQVTSRA
jgi:hypothetical protein